MYEQSARWNEYYRELDPKRRWALLEQLCLSEDDDGANAYRRRLYRARYADERQPGQEVDRFLFNCLNFAQLWSSARWFKGGARREVLRTLQQMLADEAAALGEAGERALYWEIRNAAARYLKTCEGSSYNRALFGMIASGDESRSDRICRDIWRMTEGLSGLLGLGDALSLWNRAVQDAYRTFDAGADQRLMKYREAQR